MKKPLAKQGCEFQQLDFFPDLADDLSIQRAP